MSEHYDSEPWESLRIGYEDEARAPHVGEVWRYAPDGSPVRVTVLRPEWVDYVRVPSGEPGYFGRRAWQKFWSLDPEATARAFEDASGPTPVELDAIGRRFDALGRVYLGMAGQAIAAIVEAELAKPPEGGSATIVLRHMNPVLPMPTGLAPPAADSRCARCGGPVLLVSCAREGGCRTAEERIGEPVAIAVPSGGEGAWFVRSPLGGGQRYCEGVHPTREGAIARWREKALAAERGR